MATVVIYWTEYIPGEVLDTLTGIVELSAPLIVTKKTSFVVICKLSYASVAKIWNEVVIPAVDAARPAPVAMDPVDPALAATVGPAKASYWCFRVSIKDLEMHTYPMLTLSVYLHHRSKQLPLVLICSTYKRISTLTETDSKGEKHFRR
jgi:hypothetical protein